MRIALFAREVEYKWRERLCDVIKSFVERGAELVYYKDFYYKMVEKYRLNIPEGTLFSGSEDLGEKIDIFLCLGGDGTFLESLTLIRDREIPVAGINFGRLGFLTSADSIPGTEWIDVLTSGNFYIEKRTVLEVSSTSQIDGVFPFALNEVSIQRIDPSMLSVDVSVDGLKLPTYWSDGIVLATPTGSTAYSLSIGGPIVMPSSKAVIIAPIAPHNLNVRPLVVPEEAVMKITFNSRKGGALLCIDNRSVQIENNTEFVIKKANFDLNYISLKPSGFFDAIKEKLLWGADKRNSF